jgi:hypothetical protein
MAYSLSPNLKLRIDTNLTANAKYNLLKLDELGSLAATTSASGTVQLKSQYDLFLNANDPDQGGTGRGGNIIMGAPDNQLDSIVMNASRIVVNGSWGFFDQAVANTEQEASSLTVAYFSNLSGSLDPQDVTLKLDLNNQDRSLVLGGDLRVFGSVELNTPVAAQLDLPESGTLATLANSEVFQNKQISALQNQIQDLGLANFATDFLLPGSRVLPTFTSTATVPRLDFKTGSQVTGFQAASNQASSLLFTLPSSTGESGQVLGTDGNGVLSWVNRSSTSLSVVSSASELTTQVVQNPVSGVATVTIDKSAQDPNLVWAGPTLGTAQKPTFRKLARQDLSHLVGNSMSVTWMPNQGASLNIQHNWGTRAIIVQIFDNLEFKSLDGPDVIRVDLNTVRLESRLPPPTGGWTVLLHAVL